MNVNDEIVRQALREQIASYVRRQHKRLGLEGAQALAEEIMRGEDEREAK